MSRELPPEVPNAVSVANEGEASAENSDYLLIFGFKMIKYKYSSTFKPLI